LKLIEAITNKILVGFLGFRFVGVKREPSEDMKVENGGLLGKREEGGKMM
jgi:hypothetical protein